MENRKANVYEMAKVNAAQNYIRKKSLKLLRVRRKL